MEKITNRRFKVTNSKNVTLTDIVEIKKTEKQFNKVEFKENVKEVFEEIWS